VSEAREAEPGLRRVRLYRLDYMHPIRASYQARPALSLTPSEYVKRNFAITTSGMNWAPVLRFCIEAVGRPDRRGSAVKRPVASGRQSMRAVGFTEFCGAEVLRIVPRAVPSRLAGSGTLNIDLTAGA
jgi:hypothetical protein